MVLNRRIQWTLYAVLPTVILAIMSWTFIYNIINQRYLADWQWPHDTDRTKWFSSMNPDLWMEPEYEFRPSPLLMHSRNVLSSHARDNYKSPYDPHCIQVPARQGGPGRWSIVPRRLFTFDIVFVRVGGPRRPFTSITPHDKIPTYLFP